jgi:hypothetical protein
MFLEGATDSITGQMQLFPVICANISFDSCHIDKNRAKIVPVTYNALRPTLLVTHNFVQNAHTYDVRHSISE